ncbi:MAG: serine hydrolase [Opitutales bacterium]|nr:serine hydrolase [Opitutales bacterium]
MIFLAAFAALAGGVFAAAGSLAERLEAFSPPVGGAVVRMGTPGAYETATTGVVPGGVPPEQVVYEIGSITKLFTALLLAQAVVEERVRLDTTVAEILGSDFDFADERVGRIRLVELATHTSGLPRLPENLADAADPADPYNGYDSTRLRAFLAIHQMKEPEEAGAYPVAYSNLGPGLLGYLLGHMEENTFEAVLRERILRPLGLHDTHFSVPEAAAARVVPPFSGVEEVRPWNFDSLAGCGALRSTVADLTRFAEALLAPEASPFAEAIRLLFEPRAPLGGGHMGLGIFLESIHGEQRAFHDGGTGGYSASLILTPATRHATIVLANQAGGFATRVSTGLLAPDADGDPAPVSSAADPALSLAAYEGEYRLSADALFLIRAHEDRLYLRLTGQMALPVRPLGGHRFENADVGAVIEFATGESGDVERLTLHQSGRSLPAPRIRQTPRYDLLLPEGAAEAYAGRYELAAGMVFDVRAVRRQLIVQLTGQPAIPVLAAGGDRFEYDVVVAAIEFQRGEDGAVSGLVLHQNNQEMPARRIE